MGKATAATRAALLSLTSACWVFSCFRNPPNTNMNYRIFNVCTWSFLCVRIHTGVRHTSWQWVSTTFLTRNNTHTFFIELLMGFRSLDLRVRRSTNWATLSWKQVKDNIGETSQRWGWAQKGFPQVLTCCLQVQLNWTESSSEMNWTELN